MCCVRPLKQARLSWASGLGWWQGASKTGTGKHWSAHTKKWCLLLLGCPKPTSGSVFVLQSSWCWGSALMFLQTLWKSNSDWSLPALGLGPQVSWMSPSQVRGTAQPGEGTIYSLWAASSAAGVFVTSKAGTERFCKASALLFIFSSAHKLSTNNLSYQVGEKDWVIMFVVQNEGCQF